MVNAKNFRWRFRDPADRSLLLLLLSIIAKRLEDQMADLTALNAAIAQLSTDVDTLLANQGSLDQAAVDAATAAVQAIDAKVAPAPAPEPAPAA